MSLQITDLPHLQDILALTNSYVKANNLTRMSDNFYYKHNYVVIDNSVIMNIANQTYYITKQLLVRISNNLYLNSDKESLIITSTKNIPSTFANYRIKTFNSFIVIGNLKVSLKLNKYYVKSKDNKYRFYNGFIENMYTISTPTFDYEYNNIKNLAISIFVFKNIEIAKLTQLHMQRIMYKNGILCTIDLRNKQVHLTLKMKTNGQLDTFTFKQYNLFTVNMKINKDNLEINIEEEIDKSIKSNLLHSDYHIQIVKLNNHYEREYYNIDDLQVFTLDNYRNAYYFADKIVKLDANVLTSFLLLDNFSSLYNLLEKYYTLPEKVNL